MTTWCSAGTSWALAARRPPFPSSKTRNSPTESGEVGERIVLTHLAMPRLRALSRASLLDFAMLAIVGLVAVAFAAAMFKAYYVNPGSLWRNLEEDRTAHYLFALDIALPLRELDPVELLVRLER